MLTTTRTTMATLVTMTTISSNNRTILFMVVLVVVIIIAHNHHPQTTFTPTVPGNSNNINRITTNRDSRETVSVIVVRDQCSSEGTTAIEEPVVLDDIIQHVTPGTCCTAAKTTAKTVAKTAARVVVNGLVTPTPSKYKHRSTEAGCDHLGSERIAII